MKKILTIGTLAGVFTTLSTVGAFAAGTYLNSTLTTNLNLTVNDMCSFTRTDQSLTTSMGPNALDKNMTSTFMIKCNDGAGYSVSAEFTKMTGPGADLLYSCPNGSTLCTTSTTTAAGSGTWTAVKGTSSTTVSSSTAISGKLNSGGTAYTGGVLMSKTGTSDLTGSGSGTSAYSGDTQQVSYRVGTAATQAAGSYSATATYTATQNS